MFILDDATRTGEATIDNGTVELNTRRATPISTPDQTKVPSTCCMPFATPTTVKI
jgi:hypothetical protein